MKAVPNTIEMVLLVFTNAVDFQPIKEFVQNDTMKLVQVHPGKLSFSNLIHGGRITGTPVIGKLSPVNPQVAGLAPLFCFADQGSAPIHSGAKYIKCKGFHAERV